jgi:2-phosphoglycerate kinase
VIVDSRSSMPLEGSSNYIAWKDRMEAVLEDNGLKEFIDHDIPKPPTNMLNIDAEWRKCVAKARRIILEGVRDHIVSSLHGKDTPYSMWKALMDLFQNNSDHRKLALKDKLRKIKMEKGDSIPKYLTKFTHCRDELGSVGLLLLKMIW